jgi:phytoene desaturase
MNQGKSVIVIGAGIGGLATAALLAKNGYKVTVLEKNREVGGRARQWKSKGFTFDMGPSWYMMPEVFEAYFSRFGKKTKSFYTLKRLPTHYAILFDNHRRYEIVSSYEKNRVLFEQTEPGAGKAFDEFLARSKYLYETAMKDLILLNHQSFRQVLTPNVLRNLPKMKLLTSFHDQVSQYFKNPDLQKILEFTTVFLGGSPYNTPAFYTLISHTDFNLGIYHPIGGMHMIIKALYLLCKEYGVIIKTNEPVKHIDVAKDVASDVITTKRYYKADFVVSNADYHFTETELLAHEHKTYHESYWKKKTLAPSAFLMYLGLNKKLNAAKHHMLYFNDSWEKHFKDVYEHPDWPDNPSYYVHVPSKTDSTLAPKGGETVIILVPVAPNLPDSEIMRKRFSRKIISHFEKLLGEPIEHSITTKRIFAHKDFIQDYNAYKGTAFGLAHTLFQTALFRPKNKSKKVENLYYVGQYTNPGVGVPICLLSAQITYNLINTNT